MSDNSKKHGPHGLGCNCSKENEVVAAGIALATTLSEILPALLARWQAGDSGVTVDFRFDRGDEMDSIAVRTRPLEEDGEDWSVPGPENTHLIDPSKMATDALRLELDSRPPDEEEEYIH